MIPTRRESPASLCVGRLHDLLGFEHLSVNRTVALRHKRQKRLAILAAAQVQFAVQAA